MPDLHWLPRHSDLRAAVAQLKNQSDMPADALGIALARLANHRGIHPIQGPPYRSRLPATAKVV